MASAIWSRKSGFIDGKWMGFDLSVHTDEGYKLIPVPNPIVESFSLVGVGAKDIKSISVSDDSWIVKVVTTSGSYLDIRNNDFTRVVDKGLIGIRVDRDGTTLLYFKQS